MNKSFHTEKFLISQAFFPCYLPAGSASSCRCPWPPQQPLCSLFIELCWLLGCVLQDNGCIQSKHSHQEGFPVNKDTWDYAEYQQMLTCTLPQNAQPHLSLCHSQKQVHPRGLPPPLKHWGPPRQGSELKAVEVVAATMSAIIITRSQQQSPTHPAHDWHQRKTENQLMGWAGGFRQTTTFLDFGNYGSRTHC